MTFREGQIDVAMFGKVFDDVYGRSFRAEIYDFVKRDVDYRVYITDRSGVVIFDSWKRDVGKDYSEWRDVSRTLRGEYGARTSRDMEGDPDTSVMYVASPIVAQGDIIGVLSVGKPATTANRFIESAKRKIIFSGAIVGLAVILVGVVISGMVTRPIQKLTAYAKAVKDGKRITLPSLDRSEIGELGEAFEEMRDALEGKQYVENYVQALTHEIKSPLSAIQGGVELLKEDMPKDTQAQFLENIESETGRIGTIIEKLLLLSSLEKRKSIQEAEELDMGEIVSDVKESMLLLLQMKGIGFDIRVDGHSAFMGERFLIRHAIVNLLQNAIDFTPRGGKISISVSKNDAGSVELKVSDTGPGIPGYALERVCDRFYSLKRPETGKKSSGLGLPLVIEVAHLHGGEFVISNGPDGGAVAVLILPERQ
jgi:two-component system sensor histidine kinase CreC